MKFFLTGALALSTVAPSLSGMEAINRYLNSAPQEQPATAQEIENAQDCAICQDGLDNGDAIRVLQCNPAGVPHIFHRQCINNWLLSRQTIGQLAACPMCKNPAQPSVSRKEQLIAHAKGLEYRHNPFNQNNRLHLKGGLFVTTIVLFIGKIFAYSTNKTIKFNEQTAKHTLMTLALMYSIQKYGTFDRSWKELITMIALLFTSYTINTNIPHQ